MQVADYAASLLAALPARYAAAVDVNHKDGSIFVNVPAGDFLMGDGDDEDCSPHLVHLDAYQIAVFPVTNWQYAKFVEDTGHRAPDGAEWGQALWRNGTYPPQYARHPVVCVSWHDACSYCQWAGLCLPSEAQWEHAARGPENWRYPWGDEWAPERCLNYMNKGVERTCAANDLPAGISGFGLVNCAGCVLEWCADWYDARPWAADVEDNPTGPRDGIYRIARGGHWGSGQHDCRSAYRGDFNLPEERADFRGFRPARSRAG